MATTDKRTLGVSEKGGYQTRPSAFMSAMHALPPPAYCAQPSSEAQKIACTDPKLLALAKVTIRIAEDIARKAKEDYAVVGSGDWPKPLEACHTAGCVEEAYNERLADLFASYDVELRGARTYRGLSNRFFSQSLQMLDLGEGWTFYWVQASRNHTPNDPVNAINCDDYGIVRFAHGRGETRADNGLIFARPTPTTWKVSGAAICFVHPDLWGLYGTEGAHRQRRAKRGIDRPVTAVPLHRSSTP